MEETKQQEQAQEIIAPMEETKEQEEQQQPTKSVKNFWERLDEVFNQNNELRERMNELVDQFPENERVSVFGKSALFQPERISINSKNSILYSTVPAKPGYDEGTIATEYYSGFRIRLQKSAVNIKSIQLLSAIIPVPQNSFPDNERFFGYYKLRTIANSSVGAWNPVGNYNLYDIITYNGTINGYYYLRREYNYRGAYGLGTTYVQGDVVTYLGNAYYANFSNTGVIPTETIVNPGFPTTVWIQCPNPTLDSPEDDSFFWGEVGVVGVVDNDPNLLDYGNSNNFHYIEFLTFAGQNPEDYAVPIPAFNRLFSDYQDLVDNLNLAAANADNTDLPGELYFSYNQLYKKIQVEPVTPGDPYFYIPISYTDNNFAVTYPYQNQPMNVRLGFTWDGSIPGFTTKWDPNFNAFSNNDVDLALQDFIFGNNFNEQDYLTFNTYPDLVYTSAIGLYVDFVGGSTQDSQGEGNLLSIVPLNTTQLGVAYYQNNFSNPLTKIPSILTEINITLKTDKGFPYYVPNQAIIQFELAIDYK